MPIVAVSSLASPSVRFREFSRRSLLPSLPNCLWKIKTGVIHTKTYLEDGSVIGLGLWGPGDVVGKVLADFEPYEIEALTKVVVTKVSITEPEAVELLRKHIQQCQELMIIKSYHKREIVLLKFFFWMAKKFGQEVEQGKLIDFHLTHREIGELLGTTRVTITRCFSQLEQEGIIQRLRLGKIILKREEIWHYEI